MVALKPAMIMAILPSLGLVILSTSSARPTMTPAESPTNTASDQAVLDLYNGLLVMQSTVLHSLLDSTPPRFTEEELAGYEVLCFLYDRYLEYSWLLSHTHPDEPIYANYSASQFVAWKLLTTSGCNWVQNVTDSTSALQCTLETISHTCTSFHLNKLARNIRLGVATYIRENLGGATVSISNWLNTNLADVPNSAEGVILSVTRCHQDANGSFECSR